LVRLPVIFLEPPLGAVGYPGGPDYRYQQERAQGPAAEYYKAFWGWAERLEATVMERLRANYRLSLHFHFTHFMFIHDRAQGLSPRPPTKLNGRQVMGLLRAQRHGARIPSLLAPALLGIAHIGAGGHPYINLCHKQI
jgi:hypothetical protein